MNEAAFREAYPEFADTTAYPSTAVLMVLGLADERLDPELWQDTLTQGVGLYAAHSLVVMSKAAAQATPGTPEAVLTAQTVGPISKQFDVHMTAIKGAGYWNTTSYGQQFAYLARMVGNAAPSQFYGA